ncbi:MAG: mandelate racemase/muconate lactonizing enzyme family protein [Anaerolineae bacterium]
MRIAAIESLYWGAYPRVLAVRVHTDTGLIGLGETVDKIPGSRGALHGTLAPLLLGQDPLDIEGLWQTVANNILYHGFAGAEMRALSAVDIALWDLMGKHYDASVYHLLGGRSREAVPTYNTCTGFGEMDDYALWHEDAGELARQLLDDGLRAMKIWPFDPASYDSGGQYISPQGVESGLRPIRQIREAVGEAMEIGIELHFRWNRASMERIVQALEPYDILFVEDPIHAVHPDEIKALSQHTSIPIVGSELLLTRWQVREWLEKHVSQILMTEPLWTGGITETRKLAALGDTFGVPIVLHNIAGPIGHAACMHLGAHIPNLFMVESVRAFARTYFPAISDLAPRVSEGKLPVPEGPGLGVDLKDEALEREDLSRIVTDESTLDAAGEHWRYALGFSHAPPGKEA